MKVSVLMPVIRMNLMQGVYNSLKECCHSQWELVIVSPYDLPESLKNEKNVVYINSWRSPISCRQQALIASTGEYICYAADDVIFYKDSLDIALKTLQGRDYKDLVVGKYMEHIEDNPAMIDDEYWRIEFHDAMKGIMAHLPYEYKIVNTGLITRKLMIELGGWDCQFEACAMACMDLSIRMQNYGARCYLQYEPIFHSSWIPGLGGDHAPIHIAQTQHDEPLINKIYCDENSIKRTKIDLDNWENTPTRWTRRFGAET